MMKALATFAAWALAAVLVLAIGLFLIVRRPDLPYAALRAKYAAPVDRYMDLPPVGAFADVHLRYRDQGPPHAETLVLVHGFAASLADWEPWVKRLSGHYRIISLDLPGHGLTLAPAGFHANADGYADLVVEVARRLGVKRFVVIGNSMGGGVAWDIALRHPDRLDGLVLVDAVGPPPPGQVQRPGGGPIVFKLLRYPVLRGVLAQVDLTPLVGQGLKSAFVDPRLVTPDLIQRYGDFSRAPGHRAILVDLVRGERMNPRSLSARLKTIRTPTLIMHGESDRLIPFASGQQMARLIPGSTFIAYPGVGHVPMEQIPDRSAADLERWLKAQGL
jgi:pimeloyl-ACP methyl ester carboxylesterase